MEKQTTGATGTRRRGGRGARERILKAAAELFYEEGIHATGVARLAEKAEVSSRTFYQHFPSKNVLVEEYLKTFDEQISRNFDELLNGSGLSPQEQLLSVFTKVAEDPMTPSVASMMRGCPFHNAAVEAAGSMPDVTGLVQRYKQRFVERLSGIAAEAGAQDPQHLGWQLAVLVEGATALSTSLDSDRPGHAAVEAARVLIHNAVPSTPTPR
ncbi:TetR/AcrR family transcriptional regulator [Streptomyces sp. NPDC053726]|uniref:TetR/AcrR family transcriptional regulator n=1 Tax=Streptomyces sp. NPDC053726 TaxID=3365713 RepID=UPI0037CD900D